MRARARLLILVGILAAAGCLRDDSGGARPDETPAATSSENGSVDGDDAGSGEATTGGDEAPGDVDCSGITSEDVQQYALDIQLLAQVQDAGSIATATSLGYDPDRLARILESFRVVDGVSRLGDPGEAIDFYVGANDRMRELVAAGDAVTPEQIADYHAYAGDATEFLAEQLALNAALSESCPDLAD